MSDNKLSREEFLAAIKYDANGLVPAIAQDANTGAVLMLAWMNRESLQRTLSTGDVTYWARSRQAVPPGPTFFGRMSAAPVQTRLRR